jgi:hypothetical protein
VIFITYNRVKLNNPVIHPLMVVGRKNPVWVYRTHHNSLIIYLVASDLISNGKDVHHPDAGQDGL